MERQRRGGQRELDQVAAMVLHRVQDLRRRVVLRGWFAAVAVGKSSAVKRRALEGLDGRMLARAVLGRWRENRLVLSPFSPWPDPHAPAFTPIAPQRAVVIPDAPVILRARPRRILELLISPMFRGFQGELPEIVEGGEGECQRCGFCTELFGCHSDDSLLCNHCLSQMLAFRADSDSLDGDSSEDY